MSNLVYAAILPHGDVIPELAGPNAARTRPLHEAMTEVGRRLAAAQPDTVVIATPHGFRVEGAIGVSLTEHATGSLDGSGYTVTVDMPVDQLLAWRIAEEAEAGGVPAGRCIYGTGAGPSSRLPLDWGAVIPLWYCGARWARPPRVVVAVPSRALSNAKMVEFGRAVARAAAREKRRVAFIASCDWAHAHAADGPYGYHPDAAPYDAMVQETIRSGDLLRFLDTDETFIENAKPDGNWQTLMLAGAIEGTPLAGELLTYQCPTYFGMLVASYQ